MKRRVQLKLEAWFENPNRKPLVLKGARQVGKTFAIDTLGKEYVVSKRGGNYHYFDLRREKTLHSIFSETQEPLRILEYLGIKRRVRINPSTDLVFFDEIQDCPNAITSFKYFEQDMRALALIAAGSHLGLVKNEESFPVGKVDFLSLFPMTFDEFVWTLDESLHHYLDRFVLNQAELSSLPAPVHESLLTLFFYYLAVGGLPEAVLHFSQNYQDNLFEALDQVRTIQKALLTGYEADFSKYSGTVNANHIHSVFHAIPKQLAKSLDESTSRFKFTHVIPNQKGFERISGPLTWLVKSRLCIRNYIAKRSGHPLRGYTDENLFKLFFFDVGLLNAALMTPMEALIENQLDSYKGFIVENFVAQELFAELDHDLVSWTEGNAEIEFLITQGKEIAPIEVKSAMKSRRAKSLDAYIQRYHPKFAYKLSGQNIGRHEAGYLTLPLYLAGKLLSGPKNTQKDYNTLPIEE